MKRIEFISPVEAMRGNLSRTKQGLLYADNDNPAWDAPEGKRSYARNYQPIFVGAKVSKSGRKYFSVKSKTAITITPAVKQRMALLAASSEMANVIMMHLPLQYPLQQLYMANHPTGWSWKRWIMYYVRQGLDEKKSITFPNYEQYAAIRVKNPYINSLQPSDAVDLNQNFPDELLVKFWPQLANDPIIYAIGDLKGIAHNGDNWANVIGSNYNVLDVKTEEIDSVTYVTLDDQYLQHTDPTEEPITWTYCRNTDDVFPINESDEYRLTETAPNA